jgi:GNAT superfamily N-acetyltransferase
MSSSALPVIEPYLARPRDGQMQAELDAIFFDASGTKAFSSAEERAAFRARWLGRYLESDPGHAFLAIQDPGSPGESLAGYLVGSLDDPAQAARFDDLPYFKSLQQLTARYPAQLHLNLAPQWRGRGLGRALVSAFCDHARELGSPGVHVFTARGMRNVRFYESAGFSEAGCAVWNGREIVMLAKSLR